MARATVHDTADGIDRWATSRSGQARIRLHTLAPHLRRQGNEFEVYALDGHELLPHTRHFRTLKEAREYANRLWARY